MGSCNFVAFEKFTCPCYTKLQGEIITKSQDRQNFENVHAICNLHLCYNFALVLYENAQAFSRSDASNFFMYIPINILSIT